MTKQNRNAVLEEAAAVCDQRADMFAGKAGTSNDRLGKLALDSCADTARKCAELIRALKTELATPAGEPS